MRFKKISALILIFTMIMGLIPVLPGNIDIVEAAGYDVVVNIDDTHLTWTSEGNNGKLTQEVDNSTSAFKNIVLGAQDGYYIDSGYITRLENSITSGKYNSMSVSGDSITMDGITVTRNSNTKLTVSGSPERGVEIFLIAAKEKSSNTSKPAVEGGIGVITGLDNTMEYARYENATTWTSYTGTTGSQTVASGTWYVRYKATDTVKASYAKQVMVSSSTNSYQVRIWGIDTGHMTIVSGSENQTVDEGKAIETITIRADSDYYFPEDYEVLPQYGISVQRNEPEGTVTTLTISGKPTRDVNMNLEAATPKEKQNAPSSVVGGVLKLEGTTEGMVYADSSKPSVWEKCNFGTTETTAGDKFVKYAGTWNKLESPYVTRTVAPKEEELPTPTETYSVKIINPDNSHMLVNAAYDDEYQPEVSGAMKDVYYTANLGYEFPVSYYVKPEYGVRVERVDSKTIKVTGTPTDDVVITLNAASVITITYHTVTVTNGSGSGKYVSGDIVTITADTKQGMNFSRWNIKKGSVSLANSRSATTTFVMRSANVEIEAYYTEASSADIGTGTGTDTSGDSGTSTNNNTDTTQSDGAISKAAYSKNSDLLDISARVTWSGGGWKLTWSSVSGAAGYDVFAGQGKKSLKTSSVVSNLSGNGVTKTTIKTIKGKKVNKKKTYEFQIKAYRVVNRSKEYIGKSRILYVAGSKNKTYTNIKQLSPVKKSLYVNTGNTVKIGTYVKKEKSSKQLVTGRNGKKLQYISSDRSIATVNSSGTVKGVKKGSCTIYVVAWNGKRTSVKVTVQ